MIEVAIACVDYDDFLRLTLPVNARHQFNITVLTSPDDQATIRIARDCGVSLLVTTAWSYGGPFNKARALNEWLGGISIDRQNRWHLVLDADVMLPPSATLRLEGLNAQGLYGARRRLCEDEAAWNEFAKHKRTIDSFPAEELPLKNGRVWGACPTSNVAGLCGYFQLWHPKHSLGARRFAQRPTAARYDLDFALSFPDETRALIPRYDVLHLGITKVDWAGRRSKRWQNARPLELEDC